MPQNKSTPKKSGLTTEQAEQILKQRKEQSALTAQNNTEQTPTKKKRGSKPASIEANLSASTEEVKQMLGNVLYWYNRDIVKSDEECAERLNEFFSRIAETGEIPTVEKMCLALGTVRRTVWDWEQGSKGQVRAHIIKKAKEIMAAMDAELVSKGKIPQVTYIFRAKNFFDMRDQTDVVVTPNQPLGESVPADTIAERYKELPGE